MRDLSKLINNNYSFFFIRSRNFTNFFSFAHPIYKKQIIYPINYIYQDSHFDVPS